MSCFSPVAQGMSHRDTMSFVNHRYETVFCLFFIAKKNNKRNGERDREKMNIKNIINSSNQLLNTVY